MQKTFNKTKFFCIKNKIKTMTIRKEDIEILDLIDSGLKRLDELEMALPNKRSWIQNRLQHCRRRGWIKTTEEKGKRWRILKSGRKLLEVASERKREQAPIT